MRSALLSAFLFLSLSQLSFAGDTASESRKISQFTVLKIQGNFTVIISQGSECSLTVSGDKAAFAGIQSKNTGTNLAINADTTSKANVTLKICVKDINQISVTGTDKVSCTKELKSDDLSLNLAGNTEGTLDLKLKMLTFNCDADKAFTLTGKAEKCNAKVTGDGAIDMSTFKVDDLTIDFGSETDIKVYAHPDLHVKMGGSGNLTYYGNPKVKIFKVDGTGNPIEGK